MKKLTLLVLIASLSITLSYGQVVSTTAVGNWSKPSTRVDGVVPNVQTVVNIKAGNI